MENLNNKHSDLSILFLMTLFIVCSRGLFELSIGQMYGYIFQSLFCCLFFSVLFSKIFSINGLRLYLIGSRRPAWKINFLFYLLFFFVAAISSIYTCLFSGFEWSFLYVSVTCYLLSFFLFSSSFILAEKVRIRYDLIISVVVIILVTVAFYEQITGRGMPGSAWLVIVRPASLTGSKQHYSMILAILSLILIELYRPKKNVYLLSIIFYGSIGVFFSLTRSGFFIMFIAFVYVFILMMLGNKHLGRKIGVGLFFLLMIILVLFNTENEIISRAISTFNFSSAGNSERIDAWLRAFDLWADGPLLIGHMTGIVTQVTGKIVTGQEINHVESGVFQQVLNFGIIGAILFFYFFYAIYQSTHRKHIYLRGLLVGCLLQTFVYMSIEVIPFMFLVSLLPLISDQLTEDSRIYKNANFDLRS